MALLPAVSPRGESLLKILNIDMAVGMYINTEYRSKRQRPNVVHVMHHDVMMTNDKYYYTALNVLTSAIARSILLTHTYGRAPLHPIYSLGTY